MNSFHNKEALAKSTPNMEGILTFSLAKTSIQAQPFISTIPIEKFINKTPIVLGELIKMNLATEGKAVFLKAI